ncbi:MAG TPA: hypothetical protein VGM30_19740 [Puia sp.]|jgi:hypothetical protein
MRFHDKNNAVHLLVENSSGKVGIAENSTEFKEALFFMSREFPGMRDRFRQSIQYLCKPFFEAYFKAKDGLTEVLKREPIQKSGTLIYSPSAGYTLTEFYDLDTRNNGKEMVVNGRIAILANFSTIAHPQLVFYSRIKENQTVTFEPLSLYYEDFNAQVNIDEVLRLLLFIKYCPVETRVVAKGKKVSLAKEEYLNKTVLPIEILDSSWFTTVVRSEGFSVNGHFRLQPVGPGRTERRLVWIAPYEKTGYMRKAKVIKGPGNAGDCNQDSGTNE